MMKKFLLALFFTAFALTGAHAQPAQQSPAQPDVKPTILGRSKILLHLY